MSFPTVMSLTLRLNAAAAWVEALSKDWGAYRKDSGKAISRQEE
jgi:hypothetical protein